MRQRRSALQRVLGVDDGGQRVVVDVDGVDRVAGDVRLVATATATAWPTKYTRSPASAV